MENQPLSIGEIIAMVIGGLILLSYFVILIIAQWKIYEKAGREGWESIVPIYNIYVLFEICGKPGWWTIFVVVPCINIVGIVFLIIAYMELAKRFGKSEGFGLGLAFLGFIFIPILGFSDAVYTDPNSEVNNYLEENSMNKFN
jgi:hypothetical protein